eukprot:917656-Amphidinium_carterae.2
MNNPETSSTLIWHALQVGPWLRFSSTTWTKKPIEGPSSGFFEGVGVGQNQVKRCTLALFGPAFIYCVSLGKPLLTYLHVFPARGFGFLHNGVMIRGEPNNRPVKAEQNSKCCA